ncbi:15732_t:CDS:2 [Acaulospora colombiana]|uniref:15732_t:CDS:1 n=1 Tax=Acaulospora colombiana TaxID=27376 RepID=A0ACA9L116_9GLOM|nr:15732_t:CDS:2 [Acaulospora colombiana]
MSDRNTESLKTLTSMFPGIDVEVCEAVLNANNGEMGASITSLLGMSDPNFKGEELVPIQTEDGLVTSSSRLQIERDEELARQLAVEESEEFPVIKEKFVQVADTTKRKVKEWYDRFRQSRDEEGHSNTPLYTNLPADEADNPILDEDFLNAHSRYQNTFTHASSLNSRTDYGSRNTDFTRDTDRRNNEPIKIIRNDQNNNSLINDLSKNEGGVAPYRLIDEDIIAATDVDKSEGPNQTSLTEGSPTERRDVNRAFSREEFKKNSSE